MSRVSCRIGDSQCAARRGLLRIKSTCVASLHSTSVVGLWSSVVAYTLVPSGFEALRVDLNQRRTTEDHYPGLSRCTTFTRYPALRNSLLTSSAIITERCCPPVQPKEIVR